MEDELKHQLTQTAQQSRDKEKESFEAWYNNSKSRKKRKLKGNPAKYCRVGNDYYKHITTVDAKGNKCSELAFIRRQTLIDDFDKSFLDEVIKYDAFINKPDHLNKMDTPEYLYNIYKPLPFEPEPGEIYWTSILIRHIFGTQYEKGLDYIQLLYLNPTQILPILCLVSKQNATGKTTFLNWLRLIFGENAIIVGNQDIHGRFNGHYAGKLIIAVDESRIDKQSSLEKLKALATQKSIVMEGKFQDARNLDFFGKFILCSNYEDNFINASDEDIRYWIRKLERPENKNLNIEDDLRNEIPAFLHFLKSRQLSTEKKSRMWFAPEDIETEALQAVREQSRPWLYKDLKEYITALFLEKPGLKSFHASPTDLKKRFFERDKVELSYISRILKKEYNKTPSMQQYWPFEEAAEGKKIGRAYYFERVEFVEEELKPAIPEPEPEPETDEMNIQETLPF